MTKGLEGSPKKAIDLSQFYGTETWYKHPLTGGLYTEGVRYFAMEAGAYWFLDIVFTEYMEMMEREEFLTIELKVKGSKADIVVTDGNKNVLATREISFTDCPEGDYRFFYTGKVLLLPSEY